MLYLTCEQLIDEVEEMTEVVDDDTGDMEDNECVEEINQTSRITIWSTPDIHYLLTPGVLHLYIICWHLEHSRCTLYNDIWSTPDVHYIMTYGVLQMYII